MKEPIWIKKDHVLTMHAMQIHEHGGAHGVRDEGLLESALHRPQQLFHYDKPTIYDLAAAYGFSIIKNHLFIDGNKRSGMVTMGVFLLINGFSLEVSEAELVIVGLQLADGSLSEKEFSKWLEKNSKTSGGLS